MREPRILYNKFQRHRFGRITCRELFPAPKHLTPSCEILSTPLSRSLDQGHKYTYYGQVAAFKNYATCSSDEHPAFAKGCDLHVVAGFLEFPGIRRCFTFYAIFLKLKFCLNLPWIRLKYF